MMAQHEAKDMMLNLVEAYMESRDFESNAENFEFSHADVVEILLPYAKYVQHARSEMRERAYDTALKNFLRLKDVYAYNKEGFQLPESVAVEAEVSKAARTVLDMIRFESVENLQAIIKADMN